METAATIKIRDTLKKIKYTKTKINKETGEKYTQVISVPLLIKLDNEVYIYESKYMVLWDDDNGILWYYTYNNQINNEPVMIGQNRIQMPGMLCSTTYEFIQEIKAILNPDTVLKSLDVLTPDVKIYNTETPESLDDDVPNVKYRGKQAKRKDIIYSNLCDTTEAQTDYDFYVHPYNK